MNDRRSGLNAKDGRYYNDMVQVNWTSFTSISQDGSPQPSWLGGSVQPSTKLWTDPLHPSGGGGPSEEKAMQGDSSREVNPCYCYLCQASSICLSVRSGACVVDTQPPWTDLLFQVSVHHIKWEPGKSDVNLASWETLRVKILILDS